MLSFLFLAAEVALLKTCIIRPRVDNSPNDWVTFGSGADHAAHVGDSPPLLATGLQANAPNMNEAFLLTPTPYDFTSCVSGRIYAYQHLTGTFSPAYEASVQLEFPPSGGHHDPIGIALNISNGQATQIFVYPFSSAPVPITKSMADVMVMSLASHGGAWPGGGAHDLYGIWVELDYFVAGTYSDCLNRPMVDQAEAESRCQDDLVYGRVDTWVDGLRVKFPLVRYFTYALHRQCTPETAAAWDAYAAANSIDPEVAYIHHAGVRRAPSPSGWYIMNMGSAQYLAWRQQRTANALLGTEFGEAPHTTGPMDGTVYDNVLAYPEFDAAIPPVALALDPNPRVGDSDEYAGDAQGYMDDCAADAIGTQTFITNTLGKVVAPNFGDISFAMRTDAQTLVIIDSSEIIQCEIALRYDQGKLDVPNATDALARWAFIDDLCGTQAKQLMADGFLDQPKTEAAKDQSKMGVSSFFLLAHQPRLYARYVNDLDEFIVPISTWEQNDLMRVARAQLGEPVGPRTEVAVVSTQLRLFVREFENGLVYLALQKIGTSGNDVVTVTLPLPKVPLLPGAAFGAAVTVLNFSVGDGAILLNDEVETMDTLLIARTGHVALTARDGSTELAARTGHVLLEVQ